MMSVSALLPSAKQERKEIELLAADAGADPRSATMGVIGRSVVATTGSLPNLYIRASAPRASGAGARGWGFAATAICRAHANAMAPGQPGRAFAGRSPGASGVEFRRGARSDGVACDHQGQRFDPDVVSC